MTGDTLAVIIGIIALAVFISSGIMIRKIRTDGRNSLLDIYRNADMHEKGGGADDR